jgi:hypothetical protein
MGKFTQKLPGNFWVSYPLSGIKFVCCQLLAARCLLFLYSVIRPLSSVVCPLAFCYPLYEFNRFYDFYGFYELPVSYEL